MVKGPGYEAKNAYDKANRLVSKNVNGQEYCAYTYDSLDRRISAKFDSEKWLYGYDEYGQLISAKNASSKKYAYEFDKIGNRISALDNGMKLEYASNSLNQYLSVKSGSNALSIDYDSYGNMTKNGEWTYTWDLQNRLVKAEKSGMTIDYTYDYASRRIERKVTEKGNVTSHEKFLFDGFNMVSKVDLVSKFSQNFTWNGMEILGVSDSNGAKYSHIKDGNKNVLFLVNDKGERVATYAYSPFGEVTKSEGSYAQSNPYTFSSEQRDDSASLVYYNFRYYSPKLGRWLSKDPIEELGGINVFALAHNMPIGQYDNLGLVGFMDLLTIVPVIGTIINIYTDPPGSKASDYTITLIPSECCIDKTTAEGHCQQKITLQEAGYTTQYVALTTAHDAIDATIGLVTFATILYPLGFTADGVIDTIMTFKKMDYISYGAAAAKAGCICP